MCRGGAGRGRGLGPAARAARRRRVVEPGGEHAGGLGALAGREQRDHGDHTTLRGRVRGDTGSAPTPAVVFGGFLQADCAVDPPACGRSSWICRTPQLSPARSSKPGRERRPTRSTRASRGSVGLQPGELGSPGAAGSARCSGARTARGRTSPAPRRPPGRRPACAAARRRRSASGATTVSTSRRCGAGSPASARSGSRSSAATGRGARRASRGAARSPASASRALACAGGAGRPPPGRPPPGRARSADDRPRAARSRRSARESSGGAGSETSTTSRLPCTPTSTDRPAGRRAPRSSPRAVAAGASGGRAADHDPHARAAGPSPARRPGRPARRRAAVDSGPRTTASTTSASSRASQAPRVSAAAGVDGGRGEGDLPAEPQHALDQRAPLGLVGGQRRQVALEHVGGDAHQVDGLAQAQPPGQVVRGDPERLGGEPDRLAALAEPGHEVRHPGLGDQQDARPAGRRAAGRTTAGGAPSRPGRPRPSSPAASSIRRSVPAEIVRRGRRPAAVGTPVGRGRLGSVVRVAVVRRPAGTRRSRGRLRRPRHDPAAADTIRRSGCGLSGRGGCRRSGCSAAGTARPDHRAGDDRLVMAGANGRRGARPGDAPHRSSTGRAAGGRRCVLPESRSARGRRSAPAQPSGVTLLACGPFWPCSMSNDTRWPSSRVL